MAEYLEFIEWAPAEGRKTKTVDVLSVRSGDLLGTIQWFGRWRQYAFFPEKNTVWNPACLAQVNERIAQLMKERRG